MDLLTAVIVSFIAGTIFVFFILFIQTEWLPKPKLGNKVELNRSGEVTWIVEIRKYKGFAPKYKTRNEEWLNLSDFKIIKK